MLIFLILKFARYIYGLYPQFLLVLYRHVIELMWVWQRGVHELLLHAPLTPCHQFWTLRFYAELPKSFECMEPAVQWEKSNVQKTQGLTPKVRVRFKLSFQQLNPVYECLLAPLFLFSVCCPHFIRGWVDLNNKKKLMLLHTESSSRKQVV